MRKDTLDRVAASSALLAIAVWLGGLLALGAIAAPIVFAVAPFPQSADAMTLVFRRFDLVAMTCAAVVLASEAARAWMGRTRRMATGGDALRAAASTLAAAAAVYEGSSISPRIASLHFAGVLRGVGPLGAELARLHDMAELSGKAQVLLLALAIVLQTGRAAGGGQVDSRSSEP
jgi:hypothetical protein